MSQWEPNAKGRLEDAALNLFEKQGYERTSVVEIADRAGLTERTFFRYFSDKREVLFGYQDELIVACVGAIEGAPGDAAPMAMVLAALEALVPWFEERRGATVVRQSVIAANPALQERELLKQVQFIQAMADALRTRGVADREATLAASTGGLVFQVAHGRWVTEPADLSLLIHQSFVELKRSLGD